MPKDDGEVDKIDLLGGYRVKFLIIISISMLLILPLSVLIFLAWHEKIELAAVYSGLITVFGTVLGVVLGWVISEYNKRGRVIIHGISSDICAKKLEINTEEHLRKKGADTTRGLNKVDEKGQPLCEGEILVDSIDEAELISMRFAIDFHNTSSVMNFVRLIKISLRFCGYENQTVNQLKMSTTPDYYASRTKQMNLMGLDMQTCYTGVLIPIKLKYRKCLLMRRLGKLVLTYEDRFGQKSYTVLRIGKLLDESIVNSNKYLKEYEHMADSYKVQGMSPIQYEILFAAPKDFKK